MIMIDTILTKDDLRAMIREKVIVRAKDRLIINSDKRTEAQYVFDFRKILLSPNELNRITDSFLKKLSSYVDVQIGWMESAALPLVTSLVLKMNAPWFYMRKSRKKSWVMNLFEWDIDSEKPVILVDDLINSGESILRQIIALQNEGIRVAAVICILIFHPEEWYEELQKRNIKIYSLISHDEISSELWIPSINHNRETLYSFTSFSPIARFSSWISRFHIESPRPIPYFDGKNLYFGMDDGDVYALDAKTFNVVWKYQTSFWTWNNPILGSCCGNEKYIFFWTYDGAFMAIDKESGKLIWKDESADRIESSSCYIERNNSVCVGVVRDGSLNQGGIILFDAETGKIIWSVSSPKYTQGSPIYSKKYNSLFFGSNDGLFYRIDLDDGKIIWIFSFEWEMKSKPVLSEDEELIFFWAFNGILYGLDSKTGKKKVQYQTSAAIYATPYVDGEKVYFASLDKTIYALDFQSDKICWTYSTGGRIFASPEVRMGKLYCWSNDGSMYEIDALKGNLLRKWIWIERIVTSPVFLSEKNYVVRTDSNEIYLF
jgi:outer membrane protein assembly factor BamB/orotate phosphoribosyltransferase